MSGNQVSEHWGPCEPRWEGPEWRYENFHGEHFVRWARMQRPITAPTQAMAEQWVAAFNGDLASLVTRQRSEIDTLRAELADARDLLRAMWERAGGFVQPDGTLHPGLDAQMTEVAEWLGIGVTK